MNDHNDPRNRIITGANHQYEWLTWDFNDIDSTGGTGSMDLKVFRKVPNYPINYVDIVLTGNNPSGTVGTFYGKGKVHLVCP